MLSRFKLSPLAAAAALFTGVTVFSAPVSAGSLPIQDLSISGGWDIGSTSRSCVGQRHFASNGTNLGFFLNVDGTAKIYIKNKNWSIPEGFFPVTVSVDRAGPKTLQASFFDEERSLVLEWHVVASDFDLLSNGSVFRATVGRQTYEYSLAGAAVMLRAVRRCLSDLKNDGNPYAPPDANPFAETTSNPYRRM